MYTRYLEEHADHGYAEIDPTGRYGRFEDVLGKGAMKTVYRAMDEDLGMEVAWSQVKLNDLLHSPEDLQRTYSEVHLLSILKHDSIIRFYTSWINVQYKTLNFITELFTSGTLREYRKKYKRVNIHAIKIWARQILEGIVYLHGHDPPVIHRDLKCDNIFVNGHMGQVKIGDLGLAAILRGSQRAHSVIGTPEFMAPELYDENYNELVDVYSFGMCILEMLTLEYPYSECANPAQIYKKVTSGKKPRAFYKVQDFEAQRFIAKCLENVSKRLSAKELMNDPFLVLEDVIHRSIAHDDNFGVEDLRLCDLPRTNMTITGKLNSEDNTIFLKVQITDTEGTSRHVYFPFDIVNDTPIDVANEMVKDLEISDWNPSEIANMIDGEIAGLIPHWKKWDDSRSTRSDWSTHSHVHNYQEEDDEEDDDDDNARALSAPIGSHSDYFGDSSSQSSSTSEKYSNMSYLSVDEAPETLPRRYLNRNSQNSSRFCPEKYSTTGESLARIAEKQCRDMLRLERASSSKEKRAMDMRKLTRNTSLVDMRSQLLHRALVEEVNKRRLFKTAGAVEDIGFQSPFEVSGKKKTARHTTRRV